MLAGASSSNVDASNARSFGAFPGAQTQQGINNAFPFATGSHGGVPGLQYNMQSMPSRSMGIQGMPNAAAQQQAAVAQGRFAGSALPGGMQQLSRGLQGPGGQLARGGLVGAQHSPGGLAIGTGLNGLASSAGVGGLTNLAAAAAGVGGYGGGIGSGGMGDESESSVLDMNDFPSLGGRGGGVPSGLSASGSGIGAVPGGGLGGLPGSSMGANGMPLDPYGAAAAMQKVTQAHSEFSIQNEDFPALPGVAKGGDGGVMSMLRSDLGEGAGGGLPDGGGISNMAGLGGFQQQSGLGGPLAAMAASLHAQGAGQSGHGLAAMAALRQGQTNSYEQLLLQQQQQQQQMGAGQDRDRNATDRRVQGMPFALSGQSGVGGGKVQQQAPDRFGLLGLLSVIRMQDPDLTTLALGIDLTTLGLNLNSPDNLFKTFGSPWSDNAVRPEPEFVLPSCYLQQAPRLQPGSFTKFQEETLFYIFYSMPNDEAQLYAAEELATRGWAYHKELKMWLCPVPGTEPTVKSNQHERGSVFIFDTNQWERVRKDNFMLHYDQLEVRVQLPHHNQPQQQQGHNQQPR